MRRAVLANHALIGLAALLFALLVVNFTYIAATGEALTVVTAESDQYTLFGRVLNGLGAAFFAALGVQVVRSMHRTERVIRRAEARAAERRVEAEEPATINYKERDK